MSGVSKTSFYLTVHGEKTYGAYRLHAPRTTKNMPTLAASQRSRRSSTAPPSWLAPKAPGLRSLMTEVAKLNQRIACQAKSTLNDQLTQEIQEVVKPINDHGMEVVSNRE